MGGGNHIKKEGHRHRVITAPLLRPPTAKATLRRPVRRRHPQRCRGIHTPCCRTPGPHAAEAIKITAERIHRAPRHRTPTHCQPPLPTLPSLPADHHAVTPASRPPSHLGQPKQPIPPAASRENRQPPVDARSPGCYGCCMGRAISGFFDLFWEGSKTSDCQVEVKNIEQRSGGSHGAILHEMLERKAGFQSCEFIFERRTFSFEAHKIFLFERRKSRCNSNFACNPDIGRHV